MITRVTIEIDVDSDTYGDRFELESLVIDELSDLMRSDIMAGARIDTIPLVVGSRMDIVPVSKLDDDTITHCGQPVEWVLHEHGDVLNDPCYAWVCSKGDAASDYDCGQE